MGKRKGRKPGQQAAAAARKKARSTLPSRFECPFCNMHATVVCTLKPEQGRASVSCEVCGMKYDTACRTLTEPVDVYHEWLDACEEAVHSLPAAGAQRRTGTQLEEDEAEDAEGGDDGEMTPRQRLVKRAATGAGIAAKVAARHRSAAGTPGDTGAGTAAASDLQLSPSPLQRLRRGGQQAQPHEEAGSPPGSPLSGGLGGPGSPRSPLAVAASSRRRVQLMEGLEHTMRAGLQTGAALHDPAAASLLAERTGLGGAAATGALPPGSSHLQQLARLQQQQQQQQHQQERDQQQEGEQQQQEGEQQGQEEERGADGGGGGEALHPLPQPQPSPVPRRSSDGSGAGRRRQTEEQRQQSAVRAFGAYD